MASLRHTDASGRAASARALGQIAPAARPALLQLRALASKDRSTEVRKAATEAIRLIEGKE